jgi:tight adherence protein C
VLFGGLVLFYMMLAKPDASPVLIIMMSAMVLALTAGCPYVILLRRMRQRQMVITKALPDALDLLVTCLEAGLGSDAAFAKVAERSTGPLADAFNLYLRQVGLGRSRREALNHIAKRTGVRDLVRLASAVTQAEAVGSSLGDVLRMQAADLRLARKQRAERAAHRAPVLMTIPLVVCFVPAMGIVIIVPTIISLLDFVNAL